MVEHSVLDGTITTRFCDEMLDKLYDPTFDHGISEPSGIPLPSPVPLDWAISPQMTQAIRNADQAACELVESRELGFHLTSYGRTVIKSFGVSPDVWTQMIIQLAYKRLLGKNNWRRNGGTLEVASTREFYKGRTEIIRVVTSEADAWVDSMDNETSTMEIRSKLFHLATIKHGNIVAKCKEGRGVDYHLFGQILSLRKSPTG